MDIAFDGMQNPDQNAPDWNGIVETTWNWVMHRLHQTKSMRGIFLNNQDTIQSR